VEVRHGRQGCELRLDGSVASLQRAGAEVTGPVWYALAAPLWALPRHRRRSILILGLGGGSAAHVLRAAAPDAHIVGVEREPRMVAAARRHFGLGRLRVEVVVADAIAFLERERRRFDLVLEDLFFGRPSELRKPAGFPHPGLGLAARRVKRGGVLAANTIHEGPAVARTLRCVAPHATLLSIEVRGFYNRIYAAGPSALTAGRLRPELAQVPAFRTALPQLALRTLR